MTINMELSEKSINEAIMAVQIYRDSLDNKTKVLVDKTATRLKEHMVNEMSKHIDTGVTISSIKVKHRKNSYTSRVIAGGQAVWWEFGTGVVANPVGVGNYAHPKAAELGMYGIGEYGHGHGADPKGWWYYDEHGEKHHTFGIRATMFMYHSAWNVRRELPEIARGIFKT